MQNVRFSLNEKGGNLTSEASILDMYLSVGMDTRFFYFDDNFIIFLKEKDSSNPYFALRITNSDLLVPFENQLFNNFINIIVKLYVLCYTLFENINKNGDKYMIRIFNNKDIEEVMRIWKKENIKAHNFIPKEYWENNYEYVKEILPKAEIYVYIDSDKIKGFIGMNNNHIEGIFIDTDSQNKGIGTALLNKVKEDKAKLTLNVYDENKKAIKFYQKNGFEIIKENIDKETNEKEYVMIWKNPAS